MELAIIESREEKKGENRNARRRNGAKAFHARQLQRRETNDVRDVERVNFMFRERNHPFATLAFSSLARSKDIDWVHLPVPLVFNTLKKFTSNNVRIFRAV